MSLFRTSASLRHLFTASAVLALTALTTSASAQATPLSGLDKQLSRIEFGINAMGVITKSTTGPNALDGSVTTDTPSNTVGALINLRYIKNPLVGVEFNYTYARFAQDYTTTPLNFNIQANASEYSGGWVFHTPHVFGIGTFASAGVGTTAFKPSKNGGSGFDEQARFTYYYNVGVEQAIISPKIGIRASFRQAFYKAPDFETNYLDTGKRTISSEPTVGIYFKF